MAGGLEPALQVPEGAAAIHAVQRKQRGVYVPAKVGGVKLGMTPRLVYGAVVQLAKLKGFCYACDRHLANNCNITPRRVGKALTKLVGKNVIAISFVDGERRITPLEVPH
jgi:hypothetical protein